jgi:hypothetical protein
MSETEKTNWEQAWFISRVIIGFVIHVFLIVSAIGFAETVMEATFLIKDHHMDPRLTAVMACLSAFIAGMAGAYWVKAQYIRCCLPEVLDEASKKLNQ